MNVAPVIEVVNQAVPSLQRLVDLLYRFPKLSNIQTPSGPTVAAVIVAAGLTGFIDAFNPPPALSPQNSVDVVLSIPHISSTDEMLV